MKKILGSIFILISILNANVILKAPNSFMKGEGIKFSIEASGSDISFPHIDDIDGFAVENAGTSNQITIINGKRTQKTVKSYIVYPDREIVLPPFTIEIDGRDHLTKKKKVSIRKIKKTKSNLFDFQIKANKSKAYIGEDIIFTLIFKNSKHSDIIDLRFQEPSFPNFWHKQIGEPKKYEKNGFVVQELNYLLFPQKSGKLIIDPLKIDVVLMDMKGVYSFFAAPSKTKKIYSNALNFDIKPLPESVSLIGEFEIDTKINKKEIKKGESVSFQIGIKGYGNIEDIELPKLNIEDATIYENKPEKKEYIKNGRYGGEYKKSFSIVAERDFTIPSVSLKYFDKKSGKIKTLKSEVFNIKVIDKEQEKRQKKLLTVKDSSDVTSRQAKVKEVVKVVEMTDDQKAIFYILGFLSAVILFFVVKFIKKQKASSLENEKPLAKKVKISRSKEDLLKLLAPYVGYDKELDKHIFELEKSCTIDLKLKKKEIVNIVKSLHILN